MPTMPALPTPSFWRPTPLLLAALFLLPPLLGNALYWFDWRPHQYVNHGQLLQPPPHFRSAELSDGEGRPLAGNEAEALRGKWLLVQRVDGACGADCLAMIESLRQVQIALNAEQSRVRRLLISSAGDSELAALRRDHPEVIVARLPAGAIDGRQGAAPWNAAPAIYVVDPLANVILRYGEPVAMRGLFKDLERLLKYSWLR